LKNNESYGILSIKNIIQKDMEENPDNPRPNFPFDGYTEDESDELLDA